MAINFQAALLCLGLVYRKADQTEELRANIATRTSMGRSLFRLAYGQHDPGFDARQGRLFAPLKRPDRHRGPQSLLFNE
jgi:hypothetical protein